MVRAHIFPLHTGELFKTIRIVAGKLKKCDCDIGLSRLTKMHLESPPSLAFLGSSILRPSRDRFEIINSAV